MKKILIPVFLIILSVNLFSYESGWNISGSIKNQKLKIPGLAEICVNYKINTFYTFHRDSLIRIWDLSSGKLIDSISINCTPKYFSFSRDANTAIYFYKDNLYIMDLSAKKLIINNFFVDNTSNLSEVNYLVDYNKDLNLLYYALNYTIFKYGEYNINYTLGKFAIYNIKQDSLILIKNLSNVQTYGFDYSSSEIYYTYFYYELGIKSSGEPSSYSNKEYGINKYSVINDSIYKIGSREIKNDFQNYSDFFGKLYLDTINNYFLVGTYNFFYENGYKFFYKYNKQNDSGEGIIGSYSSSYNFDYNSSLLCFAVDNKIYRINSLNLNFLDTLFFPSKIEKFISFSLNSIMAFNHLGEIILFDNITNIHESLQNNRKILINPNPSSSYIDIYLDKTNNSIKSMNSEGYEIKIYNTYGECVKTVGANNYLPLQRIDISFLPAGIYFIQIGNYTGKFAVVR
jgi:hypothetical protein